jgi:hypothetical protein
VLDAVQNYRIKDIFIECWPGIWAYISLDIDKRGLTVGRD